MWCAVCSVQFVVGNVQVQVQVQVQCARAVSSVQRAVCSVLPATGEYKVV